MTFFYVSTYFLFDSRLFEKLNRMCLLRDIHINNWWNRKKWPVITRHQPLFAALQYYYARRCFAKYKLNINSFQKQIRILIVETFGLKILGGPVITFYNSNGVKRSKWWIDSWPFIKFPLDYSLEIT